MKDLAKPSALALTSVIAMSPELAQCRAKCGARVDASLIKCPAGYQPNCKAYRLMSCPSRPSLSKNKAVAGSRSLQASAHSPAIEFVRLEREQRVAVRSLTDHLCGSQPPADETLHHPGNDCQDTQAGAQYFLHLHDSDRVGVTTHLHVFKQWSNPEIIAAGLDVTIMHLVAFELDVSGAPSHGFSVNQWVVGDYWLSASETVELFDGWQFDLRSNRIQGVWASWHRRVTGLGAYYSHGPVTESLQICDDALDGLIEQYPERNVLQDRAFAVFRWIALSTSTSSLSINICVLRA